MKRPIEPELETTPAPPSDLTERRYVYNGTPDPNRARTLSGENVVRGNRPVKRRRRSSFNIIAAVVSVSLLIVFYVWNKITVNQLADDISKLESDYQRILSTTEVLKMDINRKSNLERIGRIATTQLGLTYPTQQPVWFELDDRLNELTREPRP
jgi:cell division protein FtsL